MKKIIFYILVLTFLTSNSFSAQKLKFSDKPKKYGGSIRNVVFAPTKDSNNVGRALVISPSCAGIRSNNIPDWKTWIKFFVNEGYTVLMLDHYSQRNIDGMSTECSGSAKKKLLDNYDIPLDILDAVEHISKMPSVDKNKIFSIGFSRGTAGNAYVASKGWYDSFGEKKLRPRAAGGLYGPCLYGAAERVLNTDIDIPLFWLMGSKDTETPPKYCVPIIKGIEDRKKTKIYWHIYEGATHCWICKSNHGKSRYMPWNGEYTKYYYNSKYTKDSMERALEFFNSFK